MEPARPRGAFAAGLVVLGAVSLIVFLVLLSAYFHVFGAIPTALTLGRRVLWGALVAALLALHLAVLRLVARWRQRHHSLPAGALWLQILLAWFGGSAVGFLAYSLWRFLTFRW